MSITKLHVVIGWLFPKAVDGFYKPSGRQAGGGSGAQCGTIVLLFLHVAVTGLPRYIWRHTCISQFQSICLYRVSVSFSLLLLAFGIKPADQ